jgi:hypothetical protein
LTGSISELSLHLTMRTTWWSSRLARPRAALFKR